SAACPCTPLQCTSCIATSSRPRSPPPPPPDAAPGSRRPSDGRLRRTREVPGATFRGVEANRLRLRGLRSLARVGVDPGQNVAFDLIDADDRDRLPRAIRQPARIDPQSDVTAEETSV